MNTAIKKFELISQKSNSCGDSPDRKIYADYSVIEHGIGSNWVHDALKVILTPRCGLGVIATRSLDEGTVLIVYGGKVITATAFEALPKALQHFPYQIGSTLFLCPINMDDIGIGERVNHSCSPNAGFRDAIHLVAMRDISVGEEILIDYATCVSTNEDAFTMNCVCGSENCRGIVSGQDWQLKSVQSRLLPYYQPYLKERVRLRRKRERFSR